MAIHAQGWKALAELVMTQDVRLDLDRFRPTLLGALDPWRFFCSLLSVIDPELRSDSVKIKTYSENKLGKEGQYASSPESFPHLEMDGSSSKSLQSVAEIEAPKPKSNISCDDTSKDEGFPYASAEGRRVRPYARRDDSLPPLVREVAIKTVANGSDAPECSVRHGDIPAVVFSVGGYTGNFFHDMSDVLIPLYLTSFQFKGRVQFFVTDYKQWWLKKYKPILRRLSRCDIIDFDSNNDVHCFHHVILGLVRDRDLILRRHPTRNPKGHSMLGFTRFLRRAYGLRRDRPLALGKNPGKKARMLIISRRGTRRLLNLHQVEAMATSLGFDVTGRL
ncbi:hga5 [Hordeum vulgare]|nr:hga5 [Hordeum vulgare]